MNKTIYLAIIITIAALMLLATIIAASAETFEITMKNNEQYTAHYKVLNPSDAVYKNCIPQFTGEVDNSFADVLPKSFNLDSQSDQDLLITFTYPPTGYYEGGMDIRCSRFLNNTFIDVSSIINPNDKLIYRIISTQAGEGQSYYLKPGYTYEFIGNPGDHKKATVQIVNTGTQDLTIKWQVPEDIDDVVSIKPIASILKIGTVYAYTIELSLPANFVSMDRNITVLIGDYAEHFRITGSTQTFKETGSALASVAFGGTQIGGTQIPTIAVVIVLVIALILLLRNNKKKRLRITK